MIPPCLRRTGLWCWATHLPSWRMQRRQQKSPAKTRRGQMDFSALQWLQTSPAAFPAVKADITASWRARDAAKHFWSDWEDWNGDLGVSQGLGTGRARENRTHRMQLPFQGDLHIALVSRQGFFIYLFHLSGSFSPMSPVSHVTDQMLMDHCSTLHRIFFLPGFHHDWFTGWELLDLTAGVNIKQYSLEARLVTHWVSAEFSSHRYFLFFPAL